MFTQDKRSVLPVGPRTGRTYPPDLLPRLQALLADLADIEFAYEKNVDALQRSPSDATLKREMLDRLRLHHEKRRALALAELALLEEQVRVFCEIEA
ncbi:hypothetical protein [Microvirga calopogonii]|uniref:hypothetical protein n=1 Tax=Microvirga calopogonii TaxID=2078013 RepID=UPI000E0CE096|nr:hypothetical protein [Microvirga calopogonii]